MTPSTLPPGAITPRRRAELQAELAAHALRLLQARAEQCPEPRTPHDRGADTRVTRQAARMLRWRLL